ncbi:dipeptidase [Saccharopolyspora sp. ASAGF58]|uniref:dipeptidase n=1 Tax=Saccharopolyspora sp. ASAGF58 TaxID=2719023 RepID=UPI00143FF889|nr:dipeptidase [Saccharopolyspora sp. ASAGF58]QIZ36526.1 membrane dipeptidase [Saccharopolyspora sp. ASAGF58]
MSSQATNEIERLVADSVVVDATAPLLAQDPNRWRHYKDGGIDVALATITSGDDVGDTVEKISGWYALGERQADSILVTSSVAGIEQAKAEGRIAIVPHFQNAAPLRRDPWMVEVYRRLGVRVIQLTYNFRNNLGDGCMEPENAGLSRFGRDAVRKMNSERVLVDLSHTGVRTTLDAMEVSERPDVFTHANARGVVDHCRNLTDDQIRMVGQKGGVIGLCAFCAFVSADGKKPTIDDLIDHLDYFVQLIGIDHVGLGIDYFDDSGWQTNVDLGVWDPEEYPRPPWPWALDGTNSVEFAQRVAERGYGNDDIRKILGGNFLRVFREVWGG